jgi:hypothetical protein
MDSQPIFIQVGDLADGFAPDSNILPAVGDFSGQTLDLHFADGTVIEHVFETASDLKWTVTAAGAEAGQSGVESYRATSVREGIYFIDFIKQSVRATSVSLVLDIKRGLFTAVIGTLPTEAETHLDAFSRSVAAFQSQPTACGHFSNDYRKLFDELPSQTRARGVCQ